MSAFNVTLTHPGTFLLVGIPGLEHLHIWISIPFCIAYTLALLVTCSLLFIIQADAALHEPMYLFLAMLAAIDLVLSSTTLPQMLAIFWFRDREINFYACLIQMFFLHSFAIMESAVLLAMAFDRYVAICKPLHYTTILTRSLIIKMGTATVTRAVALMTPLPFLLRRFHYCRGPAIAHCYCEHMAVVRLACGDTRFNNIYGIAVAMFIVVLDLLFVVLSYVFILRAVLQLASQEARYKAFGTCVSHIGAILSFYTPVVISSVMHRVARTAAPRVHILLAVFYLLFPPMVNPIIYGVKTKQVRDHVLSLFQRKDVWIVLFLSTNPILSG
ncbi:LOW QUALITY PROTEIN: olfactory receptor 52K1-like [Perognathus longimembris pacificus]|uniref:LOW QUALITY PROTEIN: olfactory receptor 52K1-like n=1 Tax=Perognathus longimembris pacificus TaxID=214514 RepID=UPI002018BC43|nr:LOW QUALITY PROTEIN: olfactory receptor 52K1-like [Perognathus longimembris pacificus]